MIEKSFLQRVILSLTLLFTLHASALEGIESTPSTKSINAEIQAAEAEAQKLIHSEELPLPLAPSVTVPSAPTAATAPPPVATTVTSAAGSATKETEIPVQLEPAKKPETGGGLLMKAIASFAVVGLMGVGAFYFLQKYRRTQIGKTTAPQIKVLTQHYLGPKKSLAIVRVAGESILIGVTDHNISMIKALSLLDEDIPEMTPAHFASIFNNPPEGNEAVPARAEQKPEASKSPEEEEEFSISGIKDFVSTRLKNMRTLE